MDQGVGRPRPQEAAGLDALRRFYIVRHAKAGDREDWPGDDRLRPLTRKGLKQAQALVDVFQKIDVSTIFSSPYLRCVQTVEPLARARQTVVKQSPSLEEGRGLEGLGVFLSDRSLGNTVLSTHGDIVWELVEDLVARELVRPGEGGYEKGSTWSLEVDDHGTPQRARYIQPP